MWSEIHVRIVLAIVAELGVVLALFGRESLEVRAIELNGKNLPLPRIVFVRFKEHRARRLVSASDAQYFEVALRELPLQLRTGGHGILLVKAIQVDLHGSIAPARP